VSNGVLCDRFCAYDSHGLYQRVYCLAREYMVKRKSYLTDLYAGTSLPGSCIGDADGSQKSSTRVDSIVSALLSEYDRLKRISEAISPALQTLVRHRFTVDMIDAYEIENLHSACSMNC